MPPIVTRRDYVPKELESAYLDRDGNGLPALALVDAGDRLAIWSPAGGGQLINPKGPGLRHLGLCATYARGAKFYAPAFRASDLRKGGRAGGRVELRREPDNEQDRNAIALIAPGATKPPRLRAARPSSGRRTSHGRRRADGRRKSPRSGATQG